MNPKSTLIPFGILATVVIVAAATPSGTSEFYQRLQELKASRPPVTVTGHSQEMESEATIDGQAQRWLRTSRTFEQLSLQDNMSGYVFPGALLWVKPLREFRVVPIPQIAGRAPVRVGIAGAIFDNADAAKELVTFEHDGSFVDFHRQSQAAIHRIKDTIPKYNLRVETASSIESALHKIGLSAKGWGAKLSFNRSKSQNRSQSFGVVSLDEAYFTQVVDTPSFEGILSPQLLKDRPALEQSLVADMAEFGEVGYVRRVTYGRRVLIVVTAATSQEELLKALSLSFGGFGVKAEAGVEEEYKELWLQMQASMVVAGGRHSATSADLATSGFGEFLTHVNQYLKATAGYDEQTGGVPLTFEVRYGIDHELVSVSESVKFAVNGDPDHQMIQYRDWPVKLSGEDARLMNGDADIHSDDWTHVCQCALKTGQGSAG